MQLVFGVKHSHFPGLGVVNEQAFLIGDSQIALGGYGYIIAVADTERGILFETVLLKIELIQARPIGCEVQGTVDTPLFLK